MRILLILLWLPACSDDSAAPASPEMAVPEAEGAEVEAAEGNGAEESEVKSNEAVAEPSAETPEPSAEPTPDVIYGRIEMLEDDEGDGPFLFLLEVGREPKPQSEIIGRIMVHAGHWEMRVIREVSTEHRSVSVIGGQGSCEARVVGARHLHAFQPPLYRDDDTTGEATFLALELGGCPRGGIVGVVGVPAADIEVHALSRDATSTPATPQLVALVRSADDELGWAEPLAANAFRMQRFAEVGVTVVAGTGTWVVREGAVLTERFNGMPDLLIKAGPLVLFSMISPSEGWVSSIEHFGSGFGACVVEDASGTPLNVRAAPRRGAPVRHTLENGARIYIAEHQGSWRRLAGLGAGWVHVSAIRCGTPP